jgi:hypothetical protein
MKGSIRAGIGFLCVFGSVGGMDNGPDSSLVLLVTTAVCGLLLMYSGVSAMKEIR